MIQDKVEFILHRVEKDEAFKRMFFKKLSTTENPYPWFEQLLKAGFLDPHTCNKNPVLEGDHYNVPYWFALDFLENLATHLAKRPDEKLLGQLVTLINSIIDFREDGKRIENPNTDYKVIRIIFKLPISRITKKHIDFIDIALANRFSAVSLLSSEIVNTVIPYLIDNSAKDLLLEAMKIVLKFKTDKKEYLSFLSFTSVIEDYWFSELIKKNGARIIDICAISLANAIIEIIKEIIAKEVNSFSVGAVPAIEDNPQNFLEDHYQLQITHLLRKTLESLKPPEQESLLKTLVNSDVQIFQRLGIHLINYYYEAYSHLFWQWNGNPLVEYELKHELFELISKNKNNFSTENVGKLINWIESIKFPATEEIPEGSDRYLKIEAHARLEWLYALEGIYDKRISELGEKYSKSYPYKIEHPGYTWWSEPVQVTQIGTPEAFSSEVLAKSNYELVNYIREYKPKERDFFHNKEDLLYSFSGVVKDNPTRFITDMKPFLELDFSFQEALISGLADAWRNKKQLALEEPFCFIKSIMAQPKFKEDSSPQKNYLVKSIADLVYEGTHDEQNTFPQQFLPNCEAILLQLVDNSFSTVTNENFDVFTSVINSPLGIVHYAMITYSLRFAKLYKKDSVEKWATPIKSYYESALQKKRTIEFQVSLGTFLPQLYYLDKEWVTNNIDIIFPKEDTLIWEYGFSSYLVHSSTLSKQIYCLLREHQHYTKALDCLTSTQKHALTKLPQHICLAYLNDLEDLSENSLLSKLVKGENVTYLFDLVTFLWHLRGKLETRMQEKIKPLWAAIIDQTSNSSYKNKYKEVLAHLSTWLILIDTIDSDVVNWMKQTNACLNDRSSLFYLEYLNSHVSKTPQFVAEIFYDLVSNVHYFPFFKQEEVISIIKTLFEARQEEKAKRICTLYLEAGFDFLRPIFEQYNSRKAN